MGIDKGSQITHEHRAGVVINGPSWDNGVPVWRVRFDDGSRVWVPENELTPPTDT